MYLEGTVDQDFYFSTSCNELVQVKMYLFSQFRHFLFIFFYFYFIHIFRHILGLSWVVCCQRFCLFQVFYNYIQYLG